MSIVHVLEKTGVMVFFSVFVFDSFCQKLYFIVIIVTKLVMTLFCWAIIGQQEIQAVPTPNANGIFIF